MATHDGRDTGELLDRITTGWRAYALLALFAFCAAFAGVVRTPPLDRDESRFAQATAQMLETGDFVRIQVQEEPRYKKPIGVHWLQAAAVASSSDVAAREIWAYRLPSVLGVVAATLATFAAGVALVGRRAAFAGAALLGVSVLLAAEGQIAKTDALLCATTALGLWGVARLRLEGDRLSALLVWAALALGALIKGPVAPMTIVLALLALSAWERRLAWLKPLAWPAGPALAFIVLAPWAVAITLATKGEFFAQAFIGDIAPKLAGGGEHPALPPGLHLALLPVLLFPASVALPAGALYATDALRRDTDGALGVRVLLAFALPTFLVFELAPTKLVHYALPVYPALALLCGAGLAWIAHTRGWRVKLAAVVLYALATAVLVAIAAILARHMPGDAFVDARRAAQAVILGAALAVAGLLALTLSRGMGAMLATLLVSGLVFAWGVRDRLLPEARDLFTSQEASTALVRAGLHPRLSANPPQRPLMIIGYAEPSLVFLTATNVRLRGPEAAAEEVALGDGALLAAKSADEFLRPLMRRGLEFRPIGPPVAGVHYNDGGRPTLLQPGIIAPAGRQP